MVNQFVFWLGLISITLPLQVILAYRDNDLTVFIEPAQSQCFYQTVKKDQSMEVEFQVIDGGDLDIDFRINSPRGIQVAAQMRTGDGVESIDKTEEGDYEICFSNTFSRMSSKTVFFEIILDVDMDGEDEEESWKNFIAPPDEQYVGDQLSSLEVAGEKMDAIKSYNAKTIQLQSLLRVFEAKDRNVVERNFDRINFWSALNIVVMATVVVLQVVMVRNMFSDKRKVRT